MAKNLEDLFQEELYRRKLRERKQKIYKVVPFLLIASMVIPFVYLIGNIANPIKKEDNIANSINKQIPIAMPPSGILKKYISIPKTNLGRLRIFLRKPLSSEQSSIGKTCGEEKESESKRSNNHSFVELLDWQSGQVVMTAFIRSGDMVEIFVPFGSYKLRFAEGTEWYGEKAKFGSEDMYEMTEPFSSESAKFEFTKENPGKELGFYCPNGNLGSKRIMKDSLPK